LNVLFVTNDSHSHIALLNTAEFTVDRNHTNVTCVTRRKCHMCDKAFSQSGHLDNHMRVHTGDKPYKCSLCNKSFSTSSHLQTHKRYVHSNIRPYDCPYCGKLFKTNSHLKCHVRTHTGAKPYSCRHCSAFYITLSTEGTSAGVTQ